MQQSPIAPITVGSWPGRTVEVTKSDTERFPPSAIVMGAGVCVCVSAIGGNLITWTSTAEYFACPGLYVGVMATDTTSTDIKRCQIGE